jgi:hypothetical protein
MFIGGASGGALADMRWICEVCGRGSWTRPEDEACREWVDIALRMSRRIGRRGLGSRVVRAVRQGWVKIIERGHEAVPC